ncbi:hypothetical protein ACWFRB_11935 [Rhodococcus sp. NPDC055112]
MSNTIKRIAVAVALSAAALGAGAGVSSAAVFDQSFNAGVGGIQLLSPGANNSTNVGSNPLCVLVQNC